MATHLKDPLLTAAKVATVLVRIGLVIGIVGLSAAFATAIFRPDLLGSHMIVRVGGASLDDLTGAALVVIGLSIATLAVMYDFVDRLARIIGTVGEGDPFTLANAGRLTRMAWLAVVVQVLAIPETLLSTYLASNVHAKVFEINSQISFTGLGLALVLFILARVFRHGAAMREDLEGTV
jgi:hypothetical protein